MRACLQMARRRHKREYARPGILHREQTMSIRLHPSRVEPTFEQLQDRFNL